MLIFSEIKTQAGRLITRIDSSQLTKVGEWVNQRYRNIVNRYVWFSLLRQYEHSVVADDDYITLPADLDYPIDVHQTQDPVIFALQRYKNFLKRQLQAKSDTGFGSILNPMGELGINRLLATTGTITIESSDASDTSQTVRVRGQIANDIHVAESLTLNGTTPVTSSKSYLAKTDLVISKSSNTTGYVIVKRSGTVIANISPREKTVRYKRYLLWPKAASAYTAFITAKKRVYPMEFDDDVPELDCADALIIGAYADCLREKRQTQKALSEEERFEREIQVLMAREPLEASEMEDQWMPKIVRNPIDEQNGIGGLVLRSSE